MTQRDPDSVRQGVLERMERGEKLIRLGIGLAVMIEAGLLAFAMLYVDWKDRVQVELFIFSIIGYTIVVLGMVALAGHMSRLTARVLAAIGDRQE